MCVGLKSVKPIRAGARISVDALPTGCYKSGTFIRGLRTNHYLMNTHQSCIHNEFVALRNRVVARPPEPTPKGSGMFNAYVRRVFRRMPTLLPWSREKSIAHQHGRVLRRSLEAISSLAVHPLTRKDAAIGFFVKKDKTNMDDPSKVNPDPRAIMPRHPRYNVSLLPYSRPVEKFLFSWSSWPNHQRGRVVLKGLDCFQRATLMRRAWTSVRDPVAVFLDCTRFDFHNQKLHLSAVQRLVRRVSSDPLLDQLLSWQQRVRGKSPNGIKFSLEWILCSGDVMTSLIGVFVMVTMVLASLRHLEIDPKRFYLLDDGDDAVLILDRSLVDRVTAELPGLFLGFGHELKIEGMTDVFERITMCQHRPTLLRGRWVMTPNPVKVLNTFFAGHALPSPRCWPAHLRAVAMCYAVLVPGCPVIGKLVDVVLRETVGIRANFRFVEGLLHKSLNRTSTSVVPYTGIDERFALWRSWDIGPEEQIQLEARLDKISVFTGLTRVPMVCNPHGVNYAAPCHERI